MATEIRIPKLGVSMSEGTIVEWLVNDGVAVAAATVIYRMETDKVETDIEAPCAGVLRILEPAGGTHPVGTVVAKIE